MIQPLDYGPLYTETNMAQFPVEPYNTLSNLLFLFVAIYWSFKIRKIADPRFRSFLRVGLPLLFLGYVGGTIYHATRSHVAWMLMDVLPIYFIAFITAFYHWKLIKASNQLIGGVFLICFLVPFLLIWFVFPDSPQLHTFGYVCLTIPVILPILIDLNQTKGIFFKQFLYPLSFLTAALIFRGLDSSRWVQVHLSIGTHWLWHTLGAITCHFLLVYMEKRTLYEKRPARGKTYL